MSVNNDKNKPAVRFSGFTEDWEQRKLGDVFEEYSEKHHEELPPLMVIQGSGTLKREESERDLQYDKSNLSNYKLAKKNDFILHLRSFEGGLEIVNCDGIVSPAYHIFHGKDINPLFYYTFFRSKKFIEVLLKPHVYGIRDGKSIDVAGMKTIEIPYTSLAEQNSIGELLGQLDNLLTLHQRKCEQLKATKTSLLQKMFPKDGEKVPEIRFSGFTEDWEQRKFGDLITEYKETVDLNCTLPVLTSSKTEGIVSQEEHFSNKQNHDITGYNIIPRGYCTYRNRSDGVDFTFNINNYCDKGIVSKFYPVFYGKNNDTTFLSLVLNNSEEVVHEIAFTATGTGQKVLAFSDLQKMFIRIPSWNEQKKIATLFNNIDNLLTLHQRKCEQLKAMKTALLQKMFV